MKIGVASYSAYLTVGFLLGTIVQVARSVDVADKPTNPNIVVLRSEKRITLAKPQMTIREASEAFTKQTGMAFSFDRAYKLSEAKYDFLLRNVTLQQALSATSYATGGVWDRTKDGYHLRKPTARDLATDLAQYEALVNRAGEYLAEVDPDDPSLTPDQHNYLRRFQDALNKPSSMIPLEPTPEMAGWQIQSTPRAISVQYEVPGKGSNSYIFGFSSPLEGHRGPSFGNGGSQ